MAQSVAGAASKNNAKKKMRKCLNSLATQIGKYSKQSIKSMFLGFISTIIDCIFTITSASIGTIIAKIIDRYDKKRRNGYCFNF